MNHALVIAGGSGTRLWPMSRQHTPKQLIPFIKGQSLLEIAMRRLEGLVPPSQRFICAARAHRDMITSQVPGAAAERYLAEPMGRDTLNAVGYAAAVLHKLDPDAVIAVFTADHVIEPVDKFQRIVAAGFNLVQEHPQTLVTFGISPTHPATGYGYLQLGESIGGHGARRVVQFKEKPALDLATQYVTAGPEQYLWNSGMFVWKASTLLDCIRRYAPDNYEGLQRIAAAWGTSAQEHTLAEVYPALRKVSVDYAVMEPASRDPLVQVAALAMPLRWLDVGSWPSYAQTCSPDASGNAVSASQAVTLDCQRCVIASSGEPHVIAAIGLKDVIVVHTEDATLICSAERAEDVKKVHEQIGKTLGPQWL